MSDQSDQQAAEQARRDFSEGHTEETAVGQPADQTVAGETPPANRDYDNMSQEDLSNEAERRGLAKSGSKDTLRKRLEANDRGES